MSITRIDARRVASELAVNEETISQPVEDVEDVEWQPLMPVNTTYNAPDYESYLEPEATFDDQSLIAWQILQRSPASPSPFNLSSDASIVQQLAEKLTQTRSLGCSHTLPSVDRPLLTEYTDFGGGNYTHTRNLPSLATTHAVAPLYGLNTTHIPAEASELLNHSGKRHCTNAPAKKRYFCPKSGCNTSCSRLSDLRRHCGDVHHYSRKSIYKCTICGYSKFRLDKMKAHIRKRRHIGVEQHVAISDRLENDGANMGIVPIIVRISATDVPSNTLATQDGAPEPSSQQASPAAITRLPLHTEWHTGSQNGLQLVRSMPISEPLLEDATASSNHPKDSQSAALDMWLNDNSTLAFISEMKARFNTNSLNLRQVGVLSSCEEVEKVFRVENRRPRSRSTSRSERLEALDLAAYTAGIRRLFTKGLTPEVRMRANSAPPPGRWGAPCDGDHDPRHSGSSGLSHSFGSYGQNAYTNTSRKSPFELPNGLPADGTTAVTKETNTLKRRRMLFVCLFHHHQEPPSVDCRRARERYLSTLKRHHERDDHRLYYCTRCFRQFDSKAERKTHTRVPQCPLRCITEGCRHYGQQPAPCNHDNQGNSQYSQWKALFRLYWPGDPVPEPWVPEDDPGSQVGPSRFGPVSPTSPVPSASAEPSPSFSPHVMSMQSACLPQTQNAQTVLPQESPRTQALKRLAACLWQRANAGDISLSAMLQLDYEDLVSQSMSRSQHYREGNPNRRLETFIKDVYLWITDVPRRSTMWWQELRWYAQDFVPSFSQQNVLPASATFGNTTSSIHGSRIPGTTNFLPSFFGDQNVAAVTGSMEIPDTAFPSYLPIDITADEPGMFMENQQNYQAGFPVNRFYGTSQSNSDQFLPGITEHRVNSQPPTVSDSQMLNTTGYPNQLNPNNMLPNRPRNFPSASSLASATALYSAGRPPSVFTDSSSIEQDWFQIENRQSMPAGARANQRRLEPRPRTDSGNASSRNYSFGSSDPRFSYPYSNGSNNPSSQ